MATGMVVHQQNGPTAMRLGQRTVSSIGHPPIVQGDGVVGVLSRTIVPSTTIRWILPARIRHPDRNDVIFVSENFVQLREYLPTQHLATIPDRLDLGCRILAAKVISDVDSTPFIDLVVKQEERLKDYDTRTRPPQILLLALDYCELAFIYAEDVTPNRVRFRVARKRLPADVSSLGQYGRHLAVDSKSCTIAVSPAYGQFGIIRLKPVPELLEEIMAFDSGVPETFTAVKEERFILVDGLILKMDFILPPPDEPSKTILALLVSNNEVTDLIVYSWSENASLKIAKPKDCGYNKLPEQDQMPLMMFSSSHATSFTLVTESGVSVYKDVLFPEIRRVHCNVDQTFPRNFVGSCRSPLWAQWAKPYRHSEYMKTNDDFFLVREDGQLSYFEILHNSVKQIDSRFVVASLNVNVDSAFAILGSFLHQGGDICVAGGDMNDGAVCHMMARMPVSHVQTITNLAPVRDMLILGPAGHGEGPKRTFLSSGRGQGHAAIAEIRLGLEARVGFIADQEDSSMATGVWLLPEPWDHLTALISYPLQTTALRVDYEQRTLEIQDDDSTIRGLQLDCQTLAMAVIKNSRLVQVTSSAITVLSPRPELGSIIRKHADRQISIASVDAENMLIAIVAKVNDGFQVLLSSIDVHGASCRIEDLPEHYSMAEEPSSILICGLMELLVLVVGTINGTIFLFAVDRGRGVRLLSQCSTLKLFPHVESSAVCSLTFLADAALEYPAVACGTRNGWLLGMTIAHGPPSTNLDRNQSTRLTLNESNDVTTVLILKPESSRRIGQTSVTLKGNPEEPSHALVSCGPELHHLSYSQPDWALSFQTSRVWFTDVLEPESDQPRISVVATLYQRASSGVGHLESTLVCLTSTQLLVSTLSLEPSNVPKRILLSGDPHKLIYAKGLSRIVVAINQTKLIADENPNRPPRRVIRPGIQFVDPDAQDSKSANKQVLLLGQAGSRISSLLSWTPMNDDAGSEMIVVGLYIDGPDTAHCDGRLIYLKLEKSDSAIGDLDIDVSRTARLVGSPVYSLAQYGPSSLVVCAGTELLIQDFAISDRRWTTRARYPLPSPAVSLHVSGPSIFATTARHSLKVFEVENGEFRLRAEEYQIRDAIRNATQFVGTTEGGLLSIATNKGGRVLGLSKREQGEFGLLFDANLPVTVNCLRDNHEGDSISTAGKQYYGSTQDGSLYQFTILSHMEWQLLDFIAHLAWKRPLSPTSLKRKSASKRKGWKKIRPTDMHVNGDEVAKLIRDGPCELRRLVEEPARPILPEQESLSLEERLKQLAVLGVPLFGASDDPVLAASQWMQKLVAMT